MTAPLARRRFLTLSAAAAGLSLSRPLRTAGAAAPVPADAPLHVWTGVALGTDACIRLYHPDATAAAGLIELCLAEVRRLEKIFSLQRPDSALVRLNRAGSLDDPPADLVRLFTRSGDISRDTGGSFDATVQPFWDLYAGHFSRAGADPAGPPAAAVAAACRLVDHRAVQVSEARIAFARPGMAATLNGMAQGYITDRIVDLLRAEGIGHTLADLGEIRALGDRPEGLPWTVGVKDPQAEEHVFRTLEIVDRAVATSGGYGTPFEPTGRFNHLFDPPTGRCSDRYLSVTVVAPDATTADGLSTAFSLMPIEAARTVLAAVPDGAAIFMLPDRSVSTIGL